MKINIPYFFMVMLVIAAFFSCKKNSDTSNKEIVLATNNNSVTESQQTIANNEDSPSIEEKEMVWIPGGTFYMGTDEKCESMCQIGGLTSDCKVHQVYVDGFWMDEHEVTNAQFEAFVKATGYKTIAEITPTSAEFPDALPEMLVVL